MFLTPGGSVLMKEGVLVAYPDQQGPGEYRLSQLVEYGQKYHYTRAAWHDVDGDGLMDIVTQRSNYMVPFAVAGKGQVVWFKNNGDGNYDDDSFKPNSWGNAQVIDSGTGAGDADMVVHDLDGDGIAEIIGCQFLPNSGQGSLDEAYVEANPPTLNILSTKTTDGFATGSVEGGQVVRTELAEELYGAFRVEAVDVNNDGATDLLVNNYRDEGKDGVVAVLERPDGGPVADADSWETHILFKGFHLSNFDPNRRRGPGQAKAFHPRHNNDQGKPWIVVSGDADPRVYLMVPDSEAPSDWNYTTLILFDTKVDVDVTSHIYNIAVDVDSDPECTRLHVPAFEEAAIYTFDGCKIAQGVTFNSFPVVQGLTDGTPEPEDLKQNKRLLYMMVTSALLIVFCMCACCCACYQSGMRSREKKRYEAALAEGTMSSQNPQSTFDYGVQGDDDDGGEDARGDFVESATVQPTTIPEDLDSEV